MPKYQYPGLGLNLRFHDQNENRTETYPIGIHTNCFGSDSEMLLVREVAMMIIMDRLTDKPDWHIKVFDDTITEKWMEEGLAFPVRPMYNEIVWDGKPAQDSDGDGSAPSPRRYYPDPLETILDRPCLEYCIKELRAKAEFFKESGLIPTLDATSSVVKSDSFVDSSLHDALRTAFIKLKEEYKDNPDWHPRTDEKVLDLVHPSLYPLVYGRTRVFEDEVVGVEDAIDKWAGKGEVIPQREPDEDRRTLHWGLGHLDGTNVGGSNVDKVFWSTKYQWLPSNVELREDGSVKFTSYINNLHPLKHREMYGTIEKLIERALPAWDLCLKRYVRWDFKAAGRTEPRFPRPDNPDDDYEDNWIPSLMDIPIPSPRPKPEEAEVEESASNPASPDEETDPDEHWTEEEDEDGNTWHGTRREIAWKKVRKPAQPAPPEFEAWEYGVQPGDSLRERFKDLQIIVKMASIELTPEKPEFPAGGWHVEGQMNEHIVATALYYLDSENVTPSHLQFRMQTDSYQEDWEVGQNNFSWMEQVYGTHLGSGSMNSSCLQNYGSVETKQGRLLAFPNVFQHRVSPFELKDRTKPGHRRFIALWLVDPLTRVINTGNVPPQQQSWWMEHAFGNLGSDNAENVPQTIAELILDKAPSHPGLEAAAKKGEPLPAELMAMVRESCSDDAVPMSLDEAKEHRLKLMEIRSAFQTDARTKWEDVGYSFCEH